MRAHKEAKNFIIDSPLGKIPNVRFSRTVSKVKKRPPVDLKLPDNGELPQKYKNIWFKKAASKEIAQNEVIAQEFFRLLSPHHPKFRLVTNEHKNVSVLSKGVTGYTPLSAIPEERLKKHIIKGNYTGLGEVLVLALLMNEIDLKLDNMGIDDESRIVKIDGDWCFAKLRDGGYAGENYQITEAIISRLPFPDTYYAYNWIGIIDETLLNISPLVVDASMSTLPHFRAEINKTLLKAITIPETLLTAFINSYVNEEKEPQFKKEMTDRLQQLRTAAMANKSFQAYLKTEGAQADLDAHILNLKQFKTAQKNFLLKADPTAEEAIRKDFLRIRANVGYIVATTPPAEIKGIPETTSTREETKTFRESPPPIATPPQVVTSIASPAIVTFAVVDSQIESPPPIATPPQRGASIATLLTVSPAIAVSAVVESTIESPPPIVTPTEAVAPIIHPIVSSTAVMASALLGSKLESPQQLPLVKSKAFLGISTILPTPDFSTETKASPQQLNLPSTPKSQSFFDRFKKGIKLGGITGIILGVLAVASVAVLRAIDILTFGISLPITIPATIGIIVGAGLVGSAIGTGVQACTRDKTPESFDTIATTSPDLNPYVDLDRSINASIRNLDMATRKITIGTRATVPYPTHLNEKTALQGNTTLTFTGP